MSQHIINSQEVLKMRKHKAILKESTSNLRTKQRKLSKVWEDYTKCKGSMIDQELLNYLDGVLMINNSKHGFTSIKSIVMADHLLHGYRQEKEKLSKYLSDLSCLFTLTIDRVQKHSHVYFCLTVHFIDDNWELKNKILNFTCPNRPSLDTFKSLLLDWNIDKNVCCTIALDHNIIIDDTDHSLPFSGKTLLHVGCFVHLFHAFNFGANFTFGVLKKLWRCCDYVHQNQLMTLSSSNNDQDFQSSLGKILMTTSKGSVLTKSISDLKCLEAALEFEESFCELAQLNPHFKSINLTREEWGEATAIYEFLKSLDNVVCYFSLNRYPTTNLYFPKVCDIYKKLRSWEKSDYWDLREMASYMRWEYFDEYWRNSSLILAIAAVLDPRFKMDIVENWYKEIYGIDAHEEHLKMISEDITHVYNKYVSSSGDANSSTSYNKMLDHLGRSSFTSNSHNNVDELDRYLKEPKFPSIEEFDILTWWRVNTPNFPILARMARDFLAIPALTPVFDSSFKSQIDDIVNSKDFDPDIIEAIVCTKSWLES